MDEVLYVDHSTTSQVLMRKYLEGLASLTLASSLDAALQLLRDHQFKLMIAGYDFAERNALELIQFVHTSPAHHQMPVIVISSSMDESLLTRILRAGANDGMSKPLRVEEFRAMVTRMLCAPYVRKLEHSVIDVACLQWRSNPGFSQFCPDLNLTVTGATREEVSARMCAALQEHSRRKGVPLGITSNETIVRHEVRLPSLHPAADPPDPR
jgi:CheY-like chemotaxis protein